MDKLKQCHYCKTMIAQKATVCPTCRKKQPGRLWVKIAFGAFFFLAIFVIATNQQQYSVPPDRKVQSETDKAIDRAIAGALTLKQSMRNPDSFKLSSVLVIKGSGAACYEYRAQNGFGGMNIGHAVLSSRGRDLRTNEMPGFRKLWKKECANKEGEEIVEAANFHLKAGT